MDPNVRQLAEAIHSAPYKIVLATTGGGAMAGAFLLSVPGGSRTVLEIKVPYSEEAFVEFLGHVPDQSCSAKTSCAMAARAHDRARWLAPRLPVIGIGCTASLATDRPKRGEHRFHISTQTDTLVTTYSLKLQKGARSREAEETILDVVLLNALARACGLSERLNVDLLPEEILVTETSEADFLGALLGGKVSIVCIGSDGKVRTDAPPPAALLPGAFNPLHQGHLLLAEVAANLLDHNVAFELSIFNVDKPPLPAAELRHRVDQFAWKAPVWLTRAATFDEKASLFPGAIFVVGADTAERIITPRYYRAGQTGVSEAMAHIRKQGCRFLVAGRPDREGRFICLEELQLPLESRDLFTGIPASAFHMPISSTALREVAQSRRPR